MKPIPELPTPVDPIALCPECGGKLLDERGLVTVASRRVCCVQRLYGRARAFGQVDPAIVLSIAR